MKFLAVIMSLALLASCASLNESECLVADWHLIGYEDGAKGQKISQIGQHRSACAKYDVVPDYHAYKAGHADGIHEYCTATRGFELGKRGGGYNGICPENLEQEFLDNYQLGKIHYGYLYRISQFNSKIDLAETRIKKLNKKVQDKEAILIDDDTNKQRRRNLLEQLKEHQQQVGELEANILEYEKLRAVAKVEYSHLQQPHYKGG